MRISRKYVYAAVALFVVAIIAIAVYNLNPATNWTPKVEILSSKDPVGSAKTYLLKLHVTDANSVTIFTNTTFAPFSVRKELIGRDNTIEQEIPLSDVNTTITVWAQTLYKAQTALATIVRNKTQTDVEREVAEAAKAAQRKIDQANWQKMLDSMPINSSTGAEGGSLGSSGDGDTVMAYSCAKRIMEKQLTSPSSADFPSIMLGDVKVTKSGRSWTVNSYVDSQNVYGANLRSPFECIVNVSADSCSGNCNSPE